MKKQLSTGLGVLALALALAACGGSPGGSSTSGGAAPSSAAPSASATATSPSESSPSASNASGASYELEAASSSAGQIVVGSNGRSVYFFTKDVKDSGKSACTGGCATSWPAVTTTSATPKVEDVGGTIGTIPTSDGKMQITINGMPIYYYGQDKAAGDVKGQGVGGVWFLVSPSGTMVTSSAGMTY
ncbi:hypothetical protein AB6813_13445 [bacterium RCC_150]